MCHVLAARPSLRPPLANRKSMVAGLFSYLRSFERGDVFAAGILESRSTCVCRKAFKHCVFH